jgi:hypothetical protein
LINAAISADPVRPNAGRVAVLRKEARADMGGSQMESGFSFIDDSNNQRSGRREQVSMPDPKVIKRAELFVIAKQKEQVAE